MAGEPLRVTAAGPSDASPELVAELGRAIQRYQASVDDFDRETARLLGINETDQRCLEILLVEVESTAPSTLATRLGLTSGSVTAMLDRLEKLGYLSRTSHPTDGRRTVVRATNLAFRRVHELIGPKVSEGNRELSARYSADQLQLIAEYLRRDCDLHDRHTNRLRSLPHPTNLS